MSSKRKQTKKAGVHLFSTIVKRKVGLKIQAKKEWYWHIVASNGRIVARSSETYSRKNRAVNSIRVASDIFQFDYEGHYYDNAGKEVERKSIVG